MNRKILILSFLGTLPLLAFQCQNYWQKYASNYKVEVIPSKIQMVNDTLTFEILIDTKDYNIKADEKRVFELYAKGHSGVYQIGQIDLVGEEQIRKTIHQKVGLKEKITDLNLIFREYKSGKSKLVSPELQIAEIVDLR